jgi:predicted Zn-dependent protease
MNKRAFRLVSLISALILLVPGFAGPGQTSPATAPWRPPMPRDSKTPFAPKPHKGNNIFKGDAEKWLADAIFEIEGEILEPVDDKFISDYISQVGQNLAKFSVAPSTKYQFVVTDSEEADSMSIGAGRIYINIGMLRSIENEDELAGVLAHEIGHDAFGHSPKTVTRQLFWMTGITKVKSQEETKAALLSLFKVYRENRLASSGEQVLGFSRFDELEADRAAFYNAYKAGYNPRALGTLLQRLERKDKESLGSSYGMLQFMQLIFGSHPPTPQRALALKWESNFVKMRKKDDLFQSSSFQEMKRHLTKGQREQDSSPDLSHATPPTLVSPL